MLWLGGRSILLRYYYQSMAKIVENDFRDGEVITSTRASNPTLRLS